MSPKKSTDELDGIENEWEEGGEDDGLETLNDDSEEEPDEETEDF